MWITCSALVKDRHGAVMACRSMHGVALHVQSSSSRPGSAAAGIRACEWALAHQRPVDPLVVCSHAVQLHLSDGITFACRGINMTLPGQVLLRDIWIIWRIHFWIHRPLCGTTNMNNSMPWLFENRCHTCLQANITGSGTLAAMLEMTLSSTVNPRGQHDESNWK